MKYVKALIVGYAASFMMFLVLAPLIMFDIAPFNLPPGSAFLSLFNYQYQPYPIIMHFVYGMFWSVVFVALLRKRASLWTGMAFGIGLWLLLMVVYSPIIGWGFFGYGDAYLLSPTDPLYLREGSSYLFITLGIHLVYGAIIGWLNPFWNQVKTL